LLREGCGDRGPRLMLHVDRRLFQNVDWALLAAVGALVLMSLMTLATLSVGRAGAGTAVRQAVWFGVGVLALVAVASLDYRRVVRAAPALYLLGLVGLTLVYAFGRSVSGARRWIVLGPLSAQPSELFKVAFVLMAVWMITSRSAQPAGHRAGSRSSRGVIRISSSPCSPRRGGSSAVSRCSRAISCSSSADSTSRARRASRSAGSWRSA